MYPPSSASIGVAAIESATVVSSSLQRARSISPLRSAMPSATNANSPNALVVCSRAVLRGWREGKLVLRGKFSRIHFTSLSEKQATQLRVRKRHAESQGESCDNGRLADYKSRQHRGDLWSFLHNHGCDMI